MKFERQSFDERIFKAPVFALRFGDDHAVDPAILARELVAARAAGAGLIVARLPEACKAGIHELERAGFLSIETLVTLNKLMPTSPPGAPRARPAGPQDHEACLAIAEHAFRDDRLRRDRRIPREIAASHRAAWIRNNLEGRADSTLVVEESGSVAGFIQCLQREQRVVIDLIAVDRGRQGRGLGTALIAGTEAHYAGRAASLVVGTQDINTGSLALYRKTGFVEQSRSRTLHYVP